MECIELPRENEIVELRNRISHPGTHTSGKRSVPRILLWWRVLGGGRVWLSKCRGQGHYPNPFRI